MRTLSKSTTAVLFAVSSLVAFNADPALAKGLESLSESSPENQEAEAKAEAKAEAHAKAEAELKAPSEASKAIAEKLFVGTSYGWVIVSKAKGDWKGSGMSDITVGYKLPLGLAPNIALSGTYRYAPVVVSGEEDGHSYRGVWDTHYFGTRLGYRFMSQLTAIGSAELGYVLTYLTPLDGLESEDEHEKNGVSVALGGGVDWDVFGQKQVTAGPRVTAAFGTVSIIQIGGALSFLF
jgi:hypothetical protein